MNPITNSTIKEQMRQRNENTARARETEIRNQQKSLYTMSPFVIGGGILGIVLAVAGIGFTGIIIGIIIGAVIWVVMNQNVKAFNENLEKQIREEYNRSDRKTQQEIDAYDRAVAMYAKKVLSKSESIAPMVDHVTNMFQRMISHADAGAHMRFIEADFTYQVTNTGISYSYQSHYSNPQDSYSFNKERYRDLSSPEECEGLAQALAKLTINKMKTLYPPNSINISLSHNDANVTLHFKGANKNFIPARDIM